MRYSIVLWPIFSAALLSGCGPAKPPAPTAAEITAPAGTYTLDPYHASLVFRADHLGFSFYTGSFATFDAMLTFDPASVESMAVIASIDVASLVIPTPPPGFRDTMLGPAWFNAAAHPEIIFESTAVTQTGPRTARVDGVMRFLGAAAPLSFDAEFVGGYAGFPPYDPQARIGFTASGVLNRSDFGLTEGLPPEGSTMGVADEISFRIDAEFLGPPAPETAPEPVSDGQ